MRLGYRVAYRVLGVWAFVAHPHPRGVKCLLRDESLTIFAADWPGGPVRKDPVEIAVAEWFALDDPPSPLGPTTAAALDVAYPRR